MSPDLAPATSTHIHRPAGLRLQWPRPHPQAVASWARTPLGLSWGLCAAGVANGVDKQMTTLDKQFYPCSSHVGLGAPSSISLSPLRSLPCPQQSARGPPVAGCPHRPEGPLGTALPVTSCQGGQGRGKQVLQMASCGCPAWAAVGTAQPPQSGRGGRSRRGCINHPQSTYCVPHTPSHCPLLCLPTFPEKGFTEGETEAAKCLHQDLLSAHQMPLSLSAS